MGPLILYFQNPKIVQNKGHITTPYFVQNKGNILCIQDCQYENGIISDKKCSAVIYVISSKRFVGGHLYFNKERPKTSSHGHLGTGVGAIVRMFWILDQKIGLRYFRFNPILK